MFPKLLNIFVNRTVEDAGTTDSSQLFSLEIKVLRVKNIIICN